MHLQTLAYGILLRIVCQKLVIFKVRKILIWAGHVARTEGMRNAHNILVGKPEEETARRRWENDIRTDLRVGRCRLDACGSG